MLSDCPLKLPASEFLQRVSELCLEEWQDTWNTAANNKLHALYPVVGTSHDNKLLSRREAVITKRLQIGHSRPTLSYLLSGEDQPMCACCDATLTVKYILLDCPKFQDVRRKYFTASSLEEFLTTSTIKTSLILLKIHIFVANSCSICYSYLFLISVLY